MIDTLKKEPLLLTSLIFSVLILIFKLIFISNTMLIDDESLYWVWGQHPAMGYIEHEPVVALMIRLFCEVFGDNSVAVRLSGIVLFTFLSLWGYLIGKEWIGEKAGIIFATLICLIPFYFGVSFVITTDTPMLFFLFLSTWYYYKAYHKDKKYFYIAGVLLGLAAMSKISAIIVAFSLFIYAFFHTNRSQYLRTKEMWFSFIIAGLIYMPYVIWNIQNDFAFLTYAKGVLAKKGSLKSFGDLWAAQAGLYLPLTFFLMLYYYIKTFFDYKKGKASEANYFFAFSSLVPFLYLIQKSYANKLEANWPAFALVGVVFILVNAYTTQWNRKWIRWSYFGSNLLSFVLTTLLMLHVVFDILPIPSKLDITNRYHKFKVIKDDFKTYYQTQMNHDVRIMSRSYQAPSMINFYVRPKLEAVCVALGNYHMTVYNSIYPDTEFRGKDFYYIYEGKGKETWYPRLFNLFDSVEEIKQFTSFRNREEVKTFTLYYCKNYLGNDIYFR